MTIIINTDKAECQLLVTDPHELVVAAKELERIHARSVKEAPENVPGLQLREIHGKPDYELWLQGIAADRVLFCDSGWQTDLRLLLCAASCL